MSIRLAICVVFVAAVVFAAGGCGESDEIKTTKVPKAAAEAKTESAGEYRIIGAMFPADEPQWFFKLAGPADKLEPIAPEFEKMLKTVRFPNGLKNAPVWDMPAGWQSGGPNPGKMAVDTIRLGPPESPLEATLTQVGGEPVANVGRWAGQVGVTGFTAADLPKYTKPLEAQNIKGLWADVRGPKNPAAARGPFMGGR
jgi:hypothetical protein